MKDTIKYYVYISDAKIDMFYPQIPKNRLKSIASELNINLNLLGAGIGATIKGNSSEETRYSKLKLITNYIEKHLNVGTVDAPDMYFKGKLGMEWGRLHDLILFRGKTANTIILLSGSPQHVIGGYQPQRSSLRRGSWSITDEALLFGSREDDLHPANLDQSPDLTAIAPDLTAAAPHWLDEDVPFRGVVELAWWGVDESRIKWPHQHFEFLARKLTQRELRDLGKPSSLLLGTPLYVGSIE